MEKLKLLMGLKVWGDVYSQSTMGLLKRFLDKLFRLACWGGSDGECSWVVDDATILVGVDKSEATFGGGE